MRWVALFAGCLLVAGAGAVIGQEEALPAGEPASFEGTEIVTPEPFDPEAATEAYLAGLSPEKKARSDRYFEGGYWLELWGFLYGLGIAWLLLGTGLSAGMRGLAERVTRFRPVHTALYSIQYIVLGSLLGFPLAVYRDYFREHQYGLATQSFGPWLGETLLELVLLVVFATLFVVMLYGVIRRAPRTWWLWGAGFGLIFLLFVLLISPVYLDPLFNTYTPLEDEAVRDPILSLARGNGIAVDNVYQYDASRQTTRISANVSGFLGTMRIRLNDNLLNRSTLPEIKAVMAHEIGHYVLNHIYELIIFFAVFLVVAFAFFRWSFEWALARWGERWQVRGIGDVAGLPLLVAVLLVFFFVTTPIINTCIRVNEAEADLFGLNAAREPDGFAMAAMQLAEYRKLDPGPVEEWIFFDHPSGRARVHMAMQWKAEHLDELDER
ncbi:MAG: M48 family metalloprotease [bacterium]|nr:M48 family metalloprotease [bacterium]